MDSSPWPNSQMVRSNRLFQMFWSRVTKDKPSARAVALINRSTGSREGSSGKCVASLAISGVIGLTARPLHR